MELLKIEVLSTAVGNGIFAIEKFKRGEKVGTIEGKIIRDADYGSEYCIGLDEGVSLEPFEPFRFLNHSCEPNCELVIWDYEDTGEQELALHTTKKIEPGAQLTIDYSWPADAAIQCQCGSKKCRGWVVAKTELKLMETVPARTAS